MLLTIDCVTVNCVTVGRNLLLRQYTSQSARCTRVTNVCGIEFETPTPISPPGDNNIACSAPRTS